MMKTLSEFAGWERVLSITEMHILCPQPAEERPMGASHFQGWPGRAGAGAGARGKNFSPDAWEGETAVHIFPPKSTAQSVLC